MTVGYHSDIFHFNSDKYTDVAEILTSVYHNKKKV